MVAAVETDVSQLEVMVLAVAAQDAAASQVEVKALGNYPSDFAEVSQLEVSAVVTASNLAEVSQLEVMVLCRGSADRHRLRAWTFTLDGHPFYALRLGMGGTVVYDQSTQRWSEWQTFQQSYWRAHLGMNWDSEIIGGDALEGLLWDLTTDSAYDDGNVPIQRICVGGFPMRLRNALGCNGVILTGSIGYSGTEVSVMLETSDNNGADFFNHGTVTITDPGQFNTEVSWHSLGTIHAPGRIFRITDTGVMTRLDGMDMW